MKNKLKSELFSSKKRGGGGGGGVDTPMHTMNSQNNLKVTTKYYGKKCLLIITKNKKYS